MKPCVILVHGYGGHSQEGWLPWLKKGLEERGAVVLVPDMPFPDQPDIFAWVTYLRELVEKPTPRTFFVGHSLGCQAILRYLEHLQSNDRIGGAVFVAGFEHLGQRYTQSPEAKKALEPWVETPIDWESIRGRSSNFVAIFSDNDSWVPVTNVEVFSRKLHAETLLLNNMGHFSGSEGTKQLPIALDKILQMIAASSMEQVNPLE